LFTGIVEKLCPVVSYETLAGSVALLALDLGPLAADLEIGSSVAVNGVCLSVTRKNGGIVYFDVTGETLKRSSLGELRVGVLVNVERSMRLTGRVEGHLVYGHVDGRGKISKIEHLVDGSVKMWVDVPPKLSPFMASKGAVAVDGVSLTVVDALKKRFSVCLIPYTTQNTTLGFKKVGDRVNVEVDAVAEYVETLLRRSTRLRLR
jgi:riboflavin synthase